MAGNLYSTGALYEHCVAVTIAEHCHCVPWLYCTVTGLYRGGPICNTVTTVTYCSLLYSPIQYLSILQMWSSFPWMQMYCRQCVLQNPRPIPSNVSQTARLLRPTTGGEMNDHGDEQATMTTSNQGHDHWFRFRSILGCQQRSEGSVLMVMGLMMPIKLEIKPWSRSKS